MGQAALTAARLGEGQTAVAILTNQEVVVKFNDVLGTPFTLRANGCLLIDGKNITAVYVSNSSGTQAVVRFQQAVRQDVSPTP